MQLNIKADGFYQTINPSTGIVYYVTVLGRQITSFGPMNSLTSDLTKHGVDVAIEGHLPWTVISRKIFS